MTTRLRPPGFGAHARRPHGLGDGARLRRDRSMLADAQRRFNAAADEEEGLRPASAPTPDPSPPRAARAVGGERAALGVGKEPDRDAALTPLTEQARALYEGRVVPVRTLARLCGVSTRTLYYHVHQQGWTRRRSSVPRDPAKSERQRQRYRERKAKEPAAPRGLKARNPDGQVLALAAAGRAAALSGAALSQALARQDAEARARMLGMLTQALRTLAAVDAGCGSKRKRMRAKPDAPRRESDCPSPREIERRIAVLRRDHDARQAALAKVAGRKI